MPKISDLISGTNALCNGEKLKCSFCGTSVLIETIESKSETCELENPYSRAVEPYIRYGTIVKNKNLYNFVCPNCSSKMVSPATGNFSEKIRIENHS